MLRLGENWPLQGHAKPRNSGAHCILLRIAMPLAVSMKTIGNFTADDSVSIAWPKQSHVFPNCLIFPVCVVSSELYDAEVEMAVTAAGGLHWS